MNQEHIVKDGTYIPVPLAQFPDIPDQPMFNPTIVRHIELDENFPYLDKSFKGRLRSALIYTIIFLLVFFYLFHVPFLNKNHVFFIFYNSKKIWLFIFYFELILIFFYFWLLFKNTQNNTFLTLKLSIFLLIFWP